MVMMILMMAMMMMMFDHQFDQSYFETEYDNDDQFTSDAVCGATLNSERLKRFPCGCNIGS